MRGSFDIRILIVLLPLLLIAAAAIVVISTLDRPFISYNDCLQGTNEQQKAGTPCELEGCPSDMTYGIINEDGNMGVCCPVGCKEGFEWR